MSCNDYFADCCDCCGGVELCCTTVYLSVECGTENCDCCAPQTVLFNGAASTPGEYSFATFFLDSFGNNIIDYIAQTPCECPARVRFVLYPSGDFDVYCGGIGPIALYFYETNNGGDNCEVGFFSAAMDDCTVVISEPGGAVSISMDVGCANDEGVIIWPPLPPA